VVRLRAWQAGHGHESVANGLHFEDAVVLSQAIEQRVQPV